MDYCKGCGAVLQSEQPDQAGYRLHDDHVYCQRCFRLTHYGDYQQFDQTMMSNEQLLQRIEQTDALYCWVVDLFNMEASNLSGLSKALKNKEVILCLTKRDLLPKNLNNQKIAKTINRLLDRLQIDLQAWVILSHHATKGLDNLIQLIKQFRQDRDVIFIGTSNAGKSTLINQLSQASVTVSPLPKTTTHFIRIETKDLGTIYDTAGFFHTDSVLNYLDVNEKQQLQPKKSIHPQVFQIYEPQALFLEGLGYIVVDVHRLSTITCYFSEEVHIHRTAVSNIDRQWQRLKEERISIEDQDLVYKKYTISRSTDFVLKEVGWFTLKGSFKSVETYFLEPVELILRKALI